MGTPATTSIMKTASKATETETETASKATEISATEIPVPATTTTTATRRVLKTETRIKKYTLTSVRTYVEVTDATTGLVLERIQKSKTNHKECNAEHKFFESRDLDNDNDNDNDDNEN